MEDRDWYPPNTMVATTGISATAHMSAQFCMDVYENNRTPIVFSGDSTTLTEKEANA